MLELMPMSNQPALIVAHPGHELMVLGWVEDAHPRVSIVTDGSGRSGQSRIQSSEQILRAAGAQAGSVWGAMSEPECYAAILNGHTQVFVDLAARLGDELADLHPPYVAGDAREGFNPTHDICRMVIDAAVKRAGRRGITIRNYAFFLFAPHDKCPVDLWSSAIWKTLPDDQLARKLAAARAYPELMAEAEAAMSGSSRKILAAHPELAAIVDASLDGMNERRLATECLMPAAGVPVLAGDKPFYEIYGEQIVAKGTYQHVIRYRDHVQPIERALAAL